MQLRRLWLSDFRSYRSAEVAFEGGLTAVIGDNGEGKTNLLEAIGYLASLRSFRGAPPDALVAHGAPRAIARATVEREGREQLIEAEITPTGRGKVQLNGQRLRRSRDLLGALRVTVFTPEDLVILKGGPAERRRYLDDAMVAATPAAEGLRTELERILRQRNALLRQAAGRMTDEVATTLDVWDQRLASTGEEMGRRRTALVAQLEPRIRAAYDRLARRAAHVEVRYEPPWMQEGLLPALADARRDDLRRGTTGVGPHRDELRIVLDGGVARTHASQGEQRSLALALRLAAHDLVHEAAGSEPVLLLDDVFSELDPERSEALVACLPGGQTLLTTAGALPAGIRPDRTVRVAPGDLSVAPARPG